MRRWLVIPSIVVHTGIIVALLFLGAWHLDKLEAGRHEVRIGYVPPPPPASEGSPAAPKATPFEHKKPITHDLVTPPETKAKPDTTPTPETSDGPGNGLGSGSGEGSGDGPGISDGPCLADCGPPVVEKPKPLVEKTVMLPPTVLMGLRIFGNTQMQPSGSVRSDMQFTHHDRLTATFQVCIDTSGNVSSARQLKSSGYASYDDDLKSGIASWRYKPYTVDGHGIPACGIVTFVYTMR